MLWDLFINSLTDRWRMICTILSFVIPYSIYKINNFLHEHSDPPWKQENPQKSKRPQN